jgi:hypothetical protein
MPARSVVAFLALVFPATLWAQERKLPDAKAFDKLVVDTLRDVHNQGADLYNISKDFTGTYRMYHGALLTVRPLLAHHPAAQKLIDEGLAAADKEANTAQKAFRLHETIEAVRAHLKGDTAKKPVESKPKDKQPVETKTKEKQPVKKPMGAGGGPGFHGTVTLKGQPLMAGDVVFVSLDKPKPIVIAAAIQGNGQYAPLEAIPPGKYVVIVTGKGVPEKYQLTTTSGLTTEVQPPPSVFNIALQ